MVKTFSQISDYGTNFELLQFHYDLWLFKIISGAITTTRKKHYSPARALDAVLSIGNGTIIILLML